MINCESSSRKSVDQTPPDEPTTNAELDQTDANALGFGFKVSCCCCCVCFLSFAELDSCDSLKLDRTAENLDQDHRWLLSGASIEHEIEVDDYGHRLVV